MKVIIIPDKNTRASAEIKTEKQPKVVVLVGFFLVMEQIYNKPYGVYSKDSAQLNDCQLKAILDHTFDGEFPDCLLESVSFNLHVYAPFLVKVLCLFVLRDKV